jgi:hypothetical protein
MSLAPSVSKEYPGLIFPLKRNNSKKKKKKIKTKFQSISFYNKKNSHSKGEHTAQWCDAQNLESDCSGLRPGSTWF